MCHDCAMQTIVADHPLVAHKLTLLRDVNTTSPNFRRLTHELVTLLAYEATRGMNIEACEVTTPVTTTQGVTMSRPMPLIVPILRAGLGMLDGMASLLPDAEVGFLGMARDEVTLLPAIYADRMPTALTGRQVFVVDPMLATGGSMGDTLQVLAKRGATDVTAITLLAAPEGVEHLAAVADELNITVTLVTASIDRHLNEHGFIVPGLGDAGDRLFGVAGE